MSKLYADLLIQTACNTPERITFFPGELIALSSDPFSAESIYMSLTYRLRAHPTDLLTHVQRIYFCYRNLLRDALYASLVDLLVTLNGKGHPLSRRLIIGSKQLLSPEQFSEITRSLASPNHLKTNKYCLFSPLSNRQPLIMEKQQTNLHGIGTDYLALALDYIEFSQLEEAIELLEAGLSEQAHRMDLQKLLIELYGSTNNFARMNAFYNTLLVKTEQLLPEWQSIIQAHSAEGSL
ncbi:MULTISPECIES: tetratricopeptide repeat protein [Methylomonas]|uniref:hypothetical protein n=1 Tax=Methylomonas TaxID=416 RepID=UPI0012328352|nr:hypothetical protein [Methylomonas rhizoryzae]